MSARSIAHDHGLAGSEGLIRAEENKVLDKGRPYRNAKSTSGPSAGWPPQ